MLNQIQMESLISDLRIFLKAKSFKKSFINLDERFCISTCPTSGFTFYKKDDLGNPSVVFIENSRELYFQVQNCKFAVMHLEDFKLSADELTDIIWENCISK